MRSKFQADEDLDARIIRGLRRLAPGVDLQTAREAGTLGLSDPDVLRFAASQDRILISQDRSTMPRHFRQFLKEQPSPGLLLVREAVMIGPVIEELALIWEASDAEEWRNGLAWIPL